MKRATTLLAAAAAVLVAGCMPRDWMLERVGLEPVVYRDFGPGFEPPISHQTNRPVGGFGGNGGGVHRTPLILVHGTTVSASFWKPAREHFRKAGYTDDELWAVSYGWNHGRYFDSNELSAVTLDRFVAAVSDYLSRKAGRPVRQFDMIGHSLGNTIIRHWARQTNSWHVLRGFVGNSGVNHGSWTLTGDPRGPNRTSAFEMFVHSPWLAALNRGGETPGRTRWMTLYDGTGTRDLFYPAPFDHSPRLEGAYNLAYNVEHGGGLGHLELANREGPLEAMLEWLRESPEPLPEASPPALRVDRGAVVADDPDAAVLCATGGEYPTAKSARAARVDPAPGVLHTCYAHSARSNLASPMARFKTPAAGTPASATAPLVVSATPAGGVFEQPQFVKLEASDPEAFIVYSTVAAELNSGMPLYDAPVYVAAPLRLTAVAFAPDGRRSEPLVLDYDISLEYVAAVNTPERQFDPTAPVEYQGRRKVGR